MENETIPHHSQEMEDLVLGTMMSSTDSLNMAVCALEDSDFYFIENKLIFQSLRELFRLDVAAEERLLIEELKRVEKLSHVGGIAYVKNLAQYSECGNNLEDAIDVIKNKATLRKLVESGKQLVQKSSRGIESAREILDDAQAQLFRIGEGFAAEGGTLLKDLLNGSKADSKKSFMKALEDRQELYKTHGPGYQQLSAVKTHFVDIDKMLGGFGNSHLIVLGARPAMGKTALALNIAENVAMRDGSAVGIFSLEMSSEEITFRFISSQSRVNAMAIKSGGITGDEYQAVNVACHALEKIQIIIDEQAPIKIGNLRNRAKRMKERYDIKLLIIDYLQLVTGSSSYRSEESRQTEVSEISRTLKLLAKELKIPILCLSQLSRKVEERTGKQPLLSDLRESGALEQDADVVMLLMRKEFYDPYDKPGLAQLNVAKNRHGATGIIELAFIKELAKFENYSKFEKQEIDPLAAMRS